MIERVEERFDLKPARLIGDMAYGAAPMLGWLVEEKQIAPHIPVWDRTQRDDETLSSSDFQWDEAGRRIPLPAGKGTAEATAHVQEPAYPHHQGWHHHLSSQPVRLCELPAEGALLSEHTDAQDRSQRP